MRTGNCIKKHFLCDTDGTRAKRRRGNCSREMSFILVGTPLLSSGVTFDGNLYNMMREHNVWFYCMLNS